MSIELSEDARNAALSSVAALIDAAGPSGRIELLTAKGVVLSVLHFSFPCAGAPDGGSMAFGPISDDANSRARGKATDARITDAANNEVFRCDVSGLDGNAVVQLNSTDIVPGGVVRLKSFTLAI